MLWFWYLDLREKKRISEEKKSVCVKRDKWRVKGGERGNKRQKRVIEEKKGNKDFWVLISFKKKDFFWVLYIFFGLFLDFFGKMMNMMTVLMSVMKKREEEDEEREY